MLKKLVTATAVAALMVGAAMPAAMADNLKIALLVKNLGNGFFDAANKGAQEAAKELGGVDIIYTGPTQATPEGQIDIINQLVSQKVTAICVSANDADALVPALQAAMKRRRHLLISVRLRAFSKDGREMNLLASATDLIGDQNSSRWPPTLLRRHQGRRRGSLAPPRPATNQNSPGST